jgi:D-threo-aldose 1-dehydrogenase
MIDSIRTQPLGHTPLSVSQLGLGSGSLGNLYVPVTDEVARATVHAAWKAGMRYFDSAPLYGSGLAERRLGQALSEFPRSDYVLSTKVGRVLEPGGASDPLFADAPAMQPRFDFSRDAVLRSLTDSLTRLGTDRIDVAYVHDPDEHFAEALDSALPTLIELRNQGIISAVGVGMNHSAMLVNFIRNADLDCVLIANRYTLLDQEAQRELLPLCHSRNVGVVIGGVFNSGILADPHSDPRFDYRPASPELVAQAKKIERICTVHGVPLLAVALQFAARHPAVDSVLIGARSRLEIDAAVAGINLPIPPDLWEDLKARGFIVAEAPTEDS